MVRPTLGSSHGFGHSDITYNLPVDSGIVSEMLGYGMYPCGIVFIGHSEESVGDGETYLSTQR